MKATTVRKLGNTLLTIILLMLIVLVVLSQSAENSNLYGGEYAIKDYLITGGSYSLDGNTWADLSEGIPGHTEDVYIRGHLSEDMQPNEDLYIRIDNLGVVFSVNGEELSSFGQPGTYPEFSRAPGMTVMQIEHPGITADDEIEFKIHNPYFESYRPDAIEKQLDTMLCGGLGDGLYHQLAGGHWLAAAFGLAMIVLGLYTFFNVLVLIKNGYIDSYKETTTLLSFSLFSFVGGIYIMNEAVFYILPLIIQNPIMCNLLDASSMMIILNAIGLNYKSAFEEKYPKMVIGVICMLIHLSTIIAYTLQLLGIRDLYETQWILMIGGGLVLFIGIPLVLYEIKVYENKMAIGIFISFLPIALATLVTFVMKFVAMFRVELPVSTRLVFAAGVFFTLVLQTGRLVSISKIQAKQTNELASAQKELSDTRISMMMSQIQPHFLYNALNTIQYQCRVDGESAAKTVESFSKFLRGNMDSLSQTEPIPLKQELQHLENYLAIERLRFPDINYVYKIKAEEFNVPPLSIQPLVENSIRYGVRAMEEGGTITIETWEDEHNNYVRVSDNGAGFDIHQKKNDGRSHVGMQNIKSRVVSMCGGHIEIDSKIGAGTRSTIVLPKGGKKR